MGNLIDAVLTGMKNIALPLLEASARVERQNKDKKTALDVCKSPIIRQLLEMYLISSKVGKPMKSEASQSMTSLPAIAPTPGAKEQKEKARLEAERQARLVTLWRVRIENLSKSTTGEILADHIRGLIHRIQCPDPTRVDVPVDPITSRPRGWAYVDFVDAKAAELAVRGHGEMVLGLIIRATRDGSVIMEQDERPKSVKKKNRK